MAARRTTGSPRPKGRARDRRVTFWTTDAERARLRELARGRGESLSGLTLERTPYTNGPAPDGGMGETA